MQLHPVFRYHHTLFWVAANKKTVAFVWLSVLSACFIAKPIFAQNRPKVGVVLSGGGAKGLAHIGVLKALEEAHIPIDYIAGTSMGAIIGGLYAAGYTTDEMTAIFLNPDFKNWLSGKMDKEYSTYYKSERATPEWVTLRVDISNGAKIRIPMSFISGAQLDYAFMEILGSASVAAKNNFDSLMVPFFCIASDIETHRSTILSEGDLGKAIRASMTIPFYFSPVKVNGKLLFDGGMYNNFPAEDMENKYHPDFIIGCKVAGNFPPPKEGDLLSFIQNMVTTNTEYSIPKEKGILIEPSLPRSTMVDFSQSENFICMGYEEMQANISAVRQLISDTITVAELQEKRRAFNEKKVPILINHVHLEGINQNQVSYFRKTIQSEIKDNSISIAKFRPHYFRLYSDLNIANISPSLKYDSHTNNYTLNMDLDMKQELLGKFGGCISSSPVSQIFIGTEYNILDQAAWHFQANTFLGRHYLSGQVLTRADIPTKLPFYLQLSYTDNRWNYFRLKGAFFDYSARNYLVQTEQNVLLQSGVPVGVRTVCEAKVAYGISRENYYNQDFVSILDTADETTFNHAVFGLAIENNTLNHSYFPYEGKYFRFLSQYIAGKETLTPGTTNIQKDTSQFYHQWVQIQAKYNAYYYVNSFWRWGISFEGFYSFQSNFFTYNSTLLNVGNFQPTFQSQTEYIPEYRSTQYLAGGIHQIVDLNRWIPNTSIRFDGYLFAPVKEIQTGDNYTANHGIKIFPKQYFLSSTAILFRIKPGTLSICLGYNERRDIDKTPWSFMINFGYILPNRRAIER